MLKTLILVRHAHRDKNLGSEADNGLSSKGQDQAEAIKEHFQRVCSNENFLLLSSPKQRCVETLSPIADAYKIKIKIEPLLDEGGALEKKVKTFIKWWVDEAPALTIACSHGDWLPLCLETLTGARAEMKKGAWAEVRCDYVGEIKLYWLLQKP